MSKKNNIEKQKFLIEVGKRVKKTRESRGFSQFELSIEAEVPKNQIGRIERGEINTSIYVLKRIANALDIKIESFFQ